MMKSITSPQAPTCSGATGKVLCGPAFEVRIPTDSTVGGACPGHPTLLSLNFSSVAVRHVLPLLIPLRPFLKVVAEYRSSCPGTPPPEGPLHTQCCAFVKGLDWPALIMRASAALFWKWGS